MISAMVSPAGSVALAGTAVRVGLGTTFSTGASLTLSTESWKVEVMLAPDPSVAVTSSV